MEALLDDFDPHVFTDLNHEFHSLLYAPCANPQVLDLVERTWSRLSGLRDTTFARIPDRPQHSVEEHAHILDLIRTGADATDIELAVRRHRLRTLDAFLAARHSHTPHD